MKRLLILAMLGVFVVGISGQAAAGDYATDLFFQTSDQSLWNPGPATMFDYSRFIGPQWNERVSIGGITEPKAFGVSLGKYGAEIWGETSGKIGFQVDGHFDSGSVDVTYPVGIKLSYSDQAVPGQAFTISSSYTAQPGASFATNFPEASISVDAIFQLYARIGAEACFGACTGGGLTLIDVSKVYPLLDMSTGDVLTSDLWGFGSLTASFPDIDTTGTLNGKTLTASGEDDFLNLMLDMDRFSPIPLGGEALGFSYDILDVKTGMALAAVQHFSFTPKLMVSFKLETGQIITMPVGSSTSFIFPEGFGDLEITPTFWLDNVFSNDTGMQIDPEFSVRALSADGYGMSLGPLFSYDWRGSLGEIDLFSKDFQLQGFERFTTASFSIGATPEPATWVLLGLGLILAGITLQRKAKKTALKKHKWVVLGMAGMLLIP